jgi:tripartite-type tricarboxylate transporter receptor subunit TctC
VNSTLNRNLPFDTARDFAPVMPALDGSVLVVHRRYREMSAARRAREISPGKLNGAIGLRHAMHMGLAQFSSMTGGRVAAVTYKGAGPAPPRCWGRPRWRSACPRCEYVNRQASALR